VDLKVSIDMIHKELQRSATILKMISPPFNITTSKVAYVLSNLRKGKTATSLYYREEFLIRSDGSKLRICIYQKDREVKDALGLLWMHGGGFGIGFPEQTEHLYELFAKEINTVIVAPDYTLSIHKPYPKALEDCFQTLNWMYEHHDELGINRNRLAIGGESAGGGLTAALALYTRDHSDIKLVFQMPLYPMLNDLCNTKSMKDNNAPVWNEKSNKKAWKMYLGPLYGHHNIPIYAAPFRNKDYHGLPPAISFVGTVDPFHDEVSIYFKRLEIAGVKTHFKTFEGCYHAFELMQPKSTPAKDAIAFLKDAYLHAYYNY
jgi:acetyl esterase/lipase